MAVIKEEDIVGYDFGDETVCTDCVTEEEDDEAEFDEIITEDDLEKKDERVFCNRCNERIRRVLQTVRGVTAIKG